MGAPPWLMLHRGNAERVLCIKVLIEVATLYVASQRLGSAL